MPMLDPARAQILRSDGRARPAPRRQAGTIALMLKLTIDAMTTSVIPCG